MMSNVYTNSRRERFATRERERDERYRLELCEAGGTLSRAGRERLRQLECERERDLQLAAVGSPFAAVRLLTYDPHTDELRGAA